jgi:hypothetical protein
MDKYAYLLTALGSATEGVYNTAASAVPVLRHCIALTNQVVAESLLVYVVALYIGSIAFCRHSPSGRERPGRTLFLGNHLVSDAGTDNVQQKGG